MKAIDRKMLRDLVAIKGQAFAIGAVMACGIAVFVMSVTTLRTLTVAKDSYYAENRLAEIFIPLVRAPVSLTGRVAEIDGVAAVDDRVVEALTLDMPDLADPAGLTRWWPAKRSLKPINSHSAPVLKPPCAAVPRRSPWSASRCLRSMSCRCPRAASFPTTKALAFSG